MNLKRLCLAAALALASLGAAACGEVVDPGSVGVKVSKFGSNAGVHPNAISPGWHMTGLGESIVDYPVIQRTYTFTREADERGPENEEIIFTDRTGLGMSADVMVVLRVRREAAPKLYTKYRLTFDQLLDGPIRNDIRTAIAAESEKVGVEQLLAGGRQTIIQRALARVQRKWAPEGVDIYQLDWIGSIRFPRVILDAITARSRADQQVLAARAQVEVAKAEADARVEVARGQAESTRLRAEALRANPEVLRQMEIERWQGLCPLDTDTCILGQGAWGLVPRE